MRNPEVKVLIELQNKSPLILIDALKVLDNAKISYSLKEELIIATPSFEDIILLNKKLGRKGLQALGLLSEGNTYEEIAIRLNITIDGVRYYIKRIFKALGVKNGRDAVRIYLTEILPNTQTNVLNSAG